jgi:VIT1/CCC1 family predicted Fe2+/Mn2+ transporter
MGGKDTVDSSIRVSAGVGLGALALSIIVAGFSRIPLGTLVLRAVVFGVLFAALTYLVIMLFRRFFRSCLMKVLRCRPPRQAEWLI